MGETRAACHLAETLLHVPSSTDRAVVRVWRISALQPKKIEVSPASDSGKRAAISKTESTKQLKVAGATGGLSRHPSKEKISGADGHSKAGKAAAVVPLTAGEAYQLFLTDLNRLPVTETTKTSLALAHGGGGGEEKHSSIPPEGSLHHSVWVDEEHRGVRGLDAGVV